MFLFLSEGAFEGRTCGYFGKLQREDCETIVLCHVHASLMIWVLWSVLRPGLQCFLQIQKTAAAVETHTQRIL